MSMKAAPILILLALIPGVLMMLLSSGCRREQPSLAVASGFMEAWKKGAYEKAYGCLSDSLKETADFQEFRGERELIAISSYAPLAQAGAQGLFFVRYRVQASWNAERAGKDPEIAGVDFLVVKGKDGWKISAMEEILKEENEKEYGSIKIAGVEDRRVRISFLDSLGKAVVTRELTLPPGEVVDYVRSAVEELDMCRDNLKRLSGALSSYGMDHGGKYPVSLEQVVPRYCESLPACPAGGHYVYVREPKLRTWFVRCTGNVHQKAGVEGDFPAFFPARGVIDREK
jgi:hypothetical protein